MNNPNPFVPQGSLLEQQSKRRSRLKLGVFCMLAIGIVGLSAMLIQGCKREESGNSPDMSQNQPPVDTNNYAETDTNSTSMEASNPPVEPTPPGGTAATPPPMPTPPVATPPAPVATPPAPTENEYVIVKGDTLAKIAKANGVTLKALEDANSGVSPTRLKVGQKLVIPAGASTTGATTAAETAAGTSAGGDEAYTVKSGDTLTRIAHRNGVTVKALMAENNLTTTHIKVGQKLNIPAKAAAAPGDVNTPPTTATPPPPAPEPMPSAPAPSTPPPAPAGGTSQ